MSLGYIVKSGYIEGSRPPCAISENRPQVNKLVFKNVLGY